MKLAPRPLALLVTASFQVAIAVTRFDKDAATTLEVRGLVAVTKMADDDPPAWLVFVTPDGRDHLKRERAAATEADRPALPQRVRGRRP